MSGQKKVIAGVAALVGAAMLWSVAPAGAGQDPAGSSQAPNPAEAYWQKFGTASWTADGLLTTSAADTSQPFGVSAGGAKLDGTRLPTTNPKEITALSFDFKPDQTGGGGGSARLVVCFNDGPDCDSYAELGPARWTAGQWTSVDGFAPSDGVNNIWINGGRYGSCPYVYDTTWAAIVACHPGAAITEIKVVNDSGWLYPGGEQVLLNNLRANGVTAAAQPPVLAESATVIPVSGRVLVRRAGSKRFVRARTPVSLRFGGVINAERGKVHLVAARKKGRQRGVFRKGQFSLRQRGNGLVSAKLEGEPPSCGQRTASTSARRTKRRLWTSAKGRFRTKGRHGAATVRGTKWVTEERCAGTYFRVRKGSVTVRDFRRGKTVVIRAGQSYLARR
jgi:hypothetical protein